MNLEKMLEKELKKNDELKKLFDEQPEKKAEYLKKMEGMWGESWGCNTINPAYCKNCIFSNGEPPFADLPEKAYCMIFDKKTDGKPADVYYNGAECEYYEKK